MLPCAACSIAQLYIAVHATYSKNVGPTSSDRSARGAHNSESAVALSAPCVGEHMGENHQDLLRHLAVFNVQGGDASVICVLVLLSETLERLVLVAFLTSVHAACTV